MEKHGNALKRRIEVGQFAEMSACVTKQLPRDIDPDVAQGWIKNPDALKRVLWEALCPPVKDGLAETITRLKTAGYLDTSFEGKEVHPLVIHPLTKEQAFAAYRASGGKTWIWGELEKNIPYTVPKAGTLDVFILGFGKAIGSDEGVALMDKLGVRTLVFEEHLQLGTKKPAYQGKNTLVALTKYFLGGDPLAPILRVDGVERILNAYDWGGDWGDWFRFPVVRK